MRGQISTRNDSGPSAARPERSGERGYTLVALLALMSILALMLTVAAPRVRHEALREREQETIFRGEEVAEAIRLYIRYTGQPPTSMKQLLEGAPVPGRTRKVQVLRPSAAIDPLSSSGEWRTVKISDKSFLDFRVALLKYVGTNQLPPTTDQHPVIKNLDQQLRNVALSLNIDKDDSPSDKEAAPGDEDESENSTGPFIGVNSRSRTDAIITYYGVDRHDQWVFTPFFR